MEAVAEGRSPVVDMLLHQTPVKLAMEKAD
jgi:hypothetical protein